MMHYNPHKTFTGPHGGGGPGAGPIAVREFLAPYLPAPLVVKERRRASGSTTTVPKSIGRVRSFFGNVGVLFRAYCYIRTHGPEGLREVSENAVLNANYLLCRVEGVSTCRIPAPLHARVRRVGPRRCARAEDPGHGHRASGCSTTASTRRRSTSR